MQQEPIDLSLDSTGLILVADDNTRNRDLLSDILQARGHTVIEAVDGEEALKMARESAPDVILLDVMMPMLDGFEVCRKLKEDPETEAIPVLLVTALSSRQDRLTGIEAGANDFLLKPIDPRDIILRVRNAVHRKRLHDHLKRSLEKLRKLEDLRDNLTRWIVHDMKAPIGGISGYLELLLMDIGDALNEEQRSYITEAHNATRRLLNMTNELLDISRLEEGKMPIERKKCDLTEIAQTSSGELASTAEQKEVRITVSRAAVETACDPAIILRVITNILSNAIRHTPAKSTIGIAVKSLEGEVRVEITDEGSGVPPEYREKIFEKFGQVDIRRDKKMYSSGLGLAFCKLAVEAHGGKIGVDNRDGKGSLFWFTIPDSIGK